MSLKAEDMSRRVERELGTLFPVPETPAELLVGSVTSNVQEVFHLFHRAQGQARDSAPVTCGFQQSAVMRTGGTRCGGRGFD